MKQPVPSGTFEWRGEQLPYFDDPAGYNTPIRNERAVEVPIARRWLETVSGVGLEVGNVLGHYRYPALPSRRIVDQFEVSPGVQNVDLFTVTDRFDWVLAVSTVEHVMHDQPPRHPLGGVDAVTHLRSLLNPGGRMLVTVPFGHNYGLDAAILLGLLGEVSASTMVRNKDGSWTEHPGAVWAEYGTVTIWANAVWIATWSA